MRISEETRKRAIQVLEELTLARKHTRKAINALPDTAFAVVERGGRKDEESKTVPRNFRHLPHHQTNVKTGDENTTVDKPLLRNALARMNQIKTAGPRDKTERIRRVAREHLIRHARKILPNTQFASLDE